MQLKHISHFIDKSVEKLFGLMPDGEAVHSYTLLNGNGIEIVVITYGATISSLKIPLQDGTYTDIVLGFDTAEDYIRSFDLPNGAPYFGTTVGRYAGRIKNGNFTLDGQAIQLNQNNNSNTLHGGNQSFSQKNWTVKNSTSGKNPSITLAYCSPDGEENFPGNLSVELTYTLSEENELILQYNAVSTENTIINLTHHGYFNLDGHNASVADQQLLVNATEILDTTDENIPTGSFLNLSGHPFDFNNPKNCPKKIDTSFVLHKEPGLAASLYSSKNNLKMSVYTDQPSVHIYVGGNCSNIIKGKENVDYHSLSGICFETQNFPDAPNHSHFPDSVLKKGEVYKHKTVYRFQSF